MMSMATKTLLTKEAIKQRLMFPSESVFLVVQRRYHPRRRLLPLFGGRRPIHDLENVHFSKIIRKRTSAGAEVHCGRIV